MIVYMKNKTIFLIINSLYGGGAEHVASRLSKVWNEKYKLFVISLAPFNEKDYVFHGNVISVSHVGTSKIWPVRILQYSNEIDRIAKLEKPSVIVSFLQNSNLVCLNTKYEAKKIVSCRNYLPRLHKGLKLKLWNLLIKKYYHRADYVVSVSEMLNMQMYTTYKLDKEKCICIYNPYDINLITHDSKELLTNGDESFFKNHRVISNVGSLATAKGQFHLIRILAEMRKTYNDLGLAIIGPDKGLLCKLKQLAKDCGVQDHVLFTGFTNNPYKYLSRSVCFVFPSLFEGFPNALAEAMICKLPVVSSNCKSGPSEILRPNTDTSYGFLVDDDLTEWLDYNVPITSTEKQYIEIIENILNDKLIHSKYSELAFKRACDFEINKIVNNWDKLFI